MATRLQTSTTTVTQEASRKSLAGPETSSQRVSVMPRNRAGNSTCTAWGGGMKTNYRTPSRRPAQPPVGWTTHQYLQLALGVALLVLFLVQQGAPKPWPDQLLRGGSLNIEATDKICSHGQMVARSGQSPRSCLCPGSLKRDSKSGVWCAWPDHAAAPEGVGQMNWAKHLRPDTKFSVWIVPTSSETDYRAARVKEEYESLRRPRLIKVFANLGEHAEKCKHLLKALPEQAAAKDRHTGLLSEPVVKVQIGEMAALISMAVVYGDGAYHSVYKSEKYKRIMEHGPIVLQRLKKDGTANLQGQLKKGNVIACLLMWQDVAPPLAAPSAAAKGEE